MGLFSFGKKNEEKNEIDYNNLPAHIGIIMDGNRRWAKRRGVSRNIGHQAGAQAFRRIVRDCEEIGIRYLTVYAFSTENWSRPKDEVDALCALFHEFVAQTRNEIGGEHTKINFLGDIGAFPKDLADEFLEVQNREVEEVRLVVNIAVNYGGRGEIVMAVNQMLQQVKNGSRRMDAVATEEELRQLLYTQDMPDPDLIIRGGGEMRLSNFLIWQAAYAEFWFSDVLWPDFTKQHLLEAVRSYQSRDRRYGGI